MDVLADVFAALRVGGIVYSQYDLRAPWGMSFARSDKAGFHVIERGRCWLRSDALAAPLALGEGDVVLIPRGFHHVLADAPARRSRPWAEVVASQGGAAGPRSAEPPVGATRVMCGAYQLAPEATHSLLSVLPAVVHLPAAHVSRELLELIRLLSREAATAAPGAQVAAARLSDVLFIYLLRAWLALQPVGSCGWLGALDDPQVARALALIHERPSAPWEVETLARQVGQSRATFARHFARLVGAPPVEYITRWRMTVAGRLLRETPWTVAEVARAAGYESEFAFSRAFKRHHGRAPIEYRRHHALPAPGASEPVPLAARRPATTRAGSAGKRRRAR